eukprot:4415952-Amphidinium_carterae.1
MEDSPEEEPSLKWRYLAIELVVWRRSATSESRSCSTSKTTPTAGPRGWGSEAIDTPTSPARALAVCEILVASDIARASFGTDEAAPPISFSINGVATGMPDSGDF